MEELRNYYTRVRFRWLDSLCVWETKTLLQVSVQVADRGLLLQVSVQVADRDLLGTRVEAESIYLNQFMWLVEFYILKIREQNYVRKS